MHRFFLSIKQEFVYNLKGRILSNLTYRVSSPRQHRRFCKAHQVDISYKHIYIKKFSCKHILKHIAYSYSIRLVTKLLKSALCSFQMACLSGCWCLGTERRSREDLVGCALSTFPNGLSMLLHLLGFVLRRRVKLHPKTKFSGRNEALKPTGRHCRDKKTTKLVVTKQNRPQLHAEVFTSTATGLSNFGIKLSICFFRPFRDSDILVP